MQNKSTITSGLHVFVRVGTIAKAYTFIMIVITKYERNGTGFTVGFFSLHVVRVDISQSIRTSAIAMKTYIQYNIIFLYLQDINVNTTRTHKYDFFFKRTYAAVVV